jgi:transmembrane sensor
MSAINTRIRELFERRSDGTITPEEDLELANYIAIPANRAAIEQLMTELWNKEPSRTSTVNSFDQGTVSDLTSDITKMRTPNLWTFAFRIAATVLCIVLAGSATYYYYHSNAAMNEVAFAQETPGRSKDPKAVILPDGSTVLLKEGSRLSFPESFQGEPTRSVTLEGEGYFDIEHDDAKPFIVHTGTVQTHVVGTAFVIKAYENDPQITVTVSRGKVRVTDELRVIGTLIKDQQITFDRQRHVVAQHEVRSDSTMAWTKQDLYFDDVTFAQAASKLSERFGIRIHFANEQNSKCRFTATFIDGESFTKVLDVICAFNHATYQQTSTGEFLIEGPGC